MNKLLICALVSFIVASAELSVSLAETSTSKKTSSETSISSIPELEPALNQIRSELSLTDAQVAQVEALIVRQFEKTKSMLEGITDLNFDAMVDILVTAREMRNEFIPALLNVLTEEQKAKLKNLPKSHGIYISAMAGWLTEGQLRKLTSHLNLTEEQLPQVRSVLQEQYDQAIELVGGLMKQEPSPDLILDSILDLRTVHRQGLRKLKALLNAEQKTKLEVKD